MQTLSIVVPLYSEKDSLEELHRRIVSVCEGMGCEFEIVFVDDGSTDSSLNVLENIRERDNRAKIIHFRTNMGKAAGLQAGFEASTGCIVITMDADLQDDPAEIPALVAALDSGLDMVSGWKKTRHDPLSKTLPSKLFNAVVRYFSGLKLHDFNCGLKAYRKEVVESLTLYGELHRYIPVLAKFNGFTVGEIPVQHHPRKHGQSKYGAKRLVTGFLDLLTVILLTRYTSKPLHFFGSVGLFCCFLGGIVNLYIVKIWASTGFTNIHGRVPLLLGAIFMVLLGIQFISTGLLAELITHGIMERKR